MWGICVDQLQVSSTTDADQLLFLDDQLFGPIVYYVKLKLFACICLKDISLERTVLYIINPNLTRINLRILQSFYSYFQGLISNQGMTSRGLELWLPPPRLYI
ncbi:LOW QUALITY PROTEIN: hypothetical protein PanWU01x14_253050 [Parasponia andersonii]|uniref:Uncharacterized protein n=1 Tax=Parasponia andersonii TaxID=3476 RepID=A0A2P5BBM4_PARAD|nr:LOW QUALITY PROTEIN: hypothetical protein PanWU01x14_253050 [Parasponia andersonii]